MTCLQLDIPLLTSRQIANTLNTRICPATSTGNSRAVEVPQERISECIAKQIVDLQDAQASHAVLAKTSAGDDPFAKVKDLITDLITDLTKKLHTETSHTSPIVMMSRRKPL